MDFSRKNIYGKVGAMRQLASVRRAVLDDGKGRGMRVVDVNNGGGWSFTVYPDRGMDIGEASFKGIPLVWLTPACGTADSYEPENFNWLRSWGGGLLTGCGLLNVGGPCEAGEAHGLHGRHLWCRARTATARFPATGRITPATSRCGVCRIMS